MSIIQINLNMLYHRATLQNNPATVSRSKTYRIAAVNYPQKKQDVNVDMSKTAIWIPCPLVLTLFKVFLENHL
jgi:hypothetical protein